MTGGIDDVADLASTELSLAAGELDAAEQVFARILSADPNHRDALLGLGEVLQARGQQAQALGLFHQALAQDPVNTRALTGAGLSLKTLGYADDAVDALMSAAARSPDAPRVFVHLASALAQADREEEAIAAYQRAIELDPTDPELHDWYNSYLGVMAHEDYLASYQRALAERPDAAPISIALAEKLLANARYGDALTVLDAALARPSAGSDETMLTTALHRNRSHVLRESGEFDAALTAAREALAGNVACSENRAEFACALMAAGQGYAEAVELLTALVAAHPDDQRLWALYATALRYAGRDAEYRRLVDYQRWVHQAAIESPAEFAGPAEFLTALRGTLLSLHTTRRHPAEQSMVNGTQTLDDLLSRQHPHIRGLADALYAQLVAFAETLPQDRAHPLLSRNTGDVDFSDSWSVRLTRGGFHKSHFHSSGWLSSAFYVAVPDEVHRGGAGWLKFGEPGFRAREPLSAEYWIKPRPGTLLVFPSYLWHGVEPLAGDAERMTVGYDVLPRPRR